MHGGEAPVGRLTIYTHSDLLAGHPRVYTHGYTHTGHGLGLSRVLKIGAIWVLLDPKTRVLALKTRDFGQNRPLGGLFWTKIPGFGTQKRVFGP